MQRVQYGIILSTSGVGLYTGHNLKHSKSTSYGYNTCKISM